MAVTVEDPPDWVDRESVTVEPDRSYVLLSPPGGDVDRRVYVTGLDGERAYGVEHGPAGERVTLTAVRDLVADGRLVPADAYDESR